jgi:uncharacterized protein YjbJ (UPF0337 family)
VFGTAQTPPPLDCIKRGNSLSVSGLENRRRRFQNESNHVLAGAGGCAGVHVSRIGPGAKTLKQEGDMKSSTQDEVKGKFHEVAGKIKEKVGKATQNPSLEYEGANEKTAGKVQKKIGEVEKVLGD